MADKNLDSVGRSSLTLSHRPDLKKLVDDSLNLPTVPAVAAQIITLLRDENVSPARLAKVIEADPGIAGKLLRVCNSSLFARPRKVTNVAQAVVMLGFNELKSIVMSAATRNIYKRFGDREKGLWEHSVGVGMATYMLASEVAPELRAEAFIGGQMHDIGKVVLNNQERVRFGEAERLAATEGSVDVEDRMFSFSHAAVGAVLAARWELSAGVEAAAFYHHNLGLCRLTAKEHLRLAACVCLGDFVCHKLHIGADVSEAWLRGEVDDAQEILGIAEHHVQTLTVGLESKFRAEIQSFS